jgi:hypothetical protein
MNKKLIIEIRKGGLGDHLFYSHLPRIAKQTGAFDTVYISNHSFFRNEDYKKLIWESNPFLDGFTDDRGVFHFSTYVNDTQNLLDTLMLLYGLEDHVRMHNPEIYYRPEVKAELKGVILYDPNFVSYTGDLKSAHLIQKWFTHNNITVDYQMAVLGKRKLILKNQHWLSAKDIFDFCSILISAEKIFCLNTGTAALATALGVKCNVFYGKGLDKGYMHSKSNNYIYLGTDYNIFDYFKKSVYIIYNSFQMLKNR